MNAPEKVTKGIGETICLLHDIDALSHISSIIYVYMLVGPIGSIHIDVPYQRTSGWIQVWGTETSVSRPFTWVTLGPRVIYL